MHLRDLESDPDFLQQSERYWFYGIILACIGYGINITLFGACAHLFYHRLLSAKRHKSINVDIDSWRRDMYSLGYTFLLFGFATASIVPVLIVGEQAFVGSRSLSSGPSQYLSEHVFTNVTTLKIPYIVSILCHCCSSGLLMRSSLIIHSYSVGRFWPKQHNPVLCGMVVMLPLCLLLASIVTGIIFVMQAIAPSTLSHGLASKTWILIWGATATVLSWGLTSLISVRLLIFRKTLLKALGKRHQIRYAGITAMLIESTGLLSSFTLFFMIAYSLKSPSLVMVPFLLTQVQVISPLLIMYRVTSNRTRSSDVSIQELTMPTFADDLAGSRETPFSETGGC